MNSADNNLHQRDFIYTCPSKVFNDHSLTLNELKIYMLIRSFMDTTGIAYPSNEWISDHLGINERNTCKNISKLVNKGYIERIIKNGQRFLRIKVAELPEKGVFQKTSPPSQKTSPPVAKDVPPPVAKDTQLYQNNITSKIINTPISPKPKKDISISFEEIEKDNPHQIQKDLIEEWKSYRKKPITLRVWNKTTKVLSELAQKDIPAIDAFETMLEKQWQGIETRYFDGELKFRSGTPKQQKSGDSFSRVMSKYKNQQGNVYDQRDNSIFG